MNKVKELFIKNVQWLTLAAGFAFLAYMAWTYFQAQPDVKVDSTTAAGPLPQLQSDIGSKVKPTIAVPKYVGQITRELNGPTTQALVGRWTTAVPLDPDVPVSGGPTRPDVQPVPNGGGAATGKGAHVTATPTLAAPNLIGTSFGVSSVMPGVFATPANANPPAPAGVTAIDKTWLTAAFTIPVDEMAKEFAAAGVAPGLVTEFLRQEVERVEVMPDGATAHSTIVKPLVGSQLAAHPLPAGYDAAYVTWADPNQAEILQSPFYAVTGGSTWVMPGQKRAAAGPFDVTKYLTGPIPDWLTPEQRKLVQDARNEEAKKKEDAEREKRKNRPPSQPPGGRNGGGRGAGGGGAGGGGGASGGGGGGEEFLPEMPDGDFSFLSLTSFRSPNNEGQALFAAANAAPPPADGPYPNDLPGAGSAPRRPGMPPPADNGEQPQGPAATAIVGAVPTSSFDPAAWAKQNGATVTAFDHDETVEVEKTYRYRMRYFILNPIYGQPNAAANPALAKVFRWESKWSEWTPSFTVPPAISFFVVARFTEKSAAVQFEVFHFSKGALRNKTFAVGIGDYIGTADGENDLATGYTLVDVRKDGKGVYALVMSPEGVLSRHDVQDSQSERYRDLKGQTQAPAVGTTGG